MSISSPSVLTNPTAPNFPEVFSAGTLLVDGQSVAVAQPVTVRQLVAQRPQRARVFEKYGISYCCCSGNRTFLEVCAEKEIDPRLVLSDLRECDANIDNSGVEQNWDWLEKTPDELRGQILEMRCIFLQAELPRLSYLIDRVVARHGVFYNELWELQNLFEEFKSELQIYLENEESHFLGILDGTGSMIEGQDLQIAVDDEIRALKSKQAHFHQMMSEISSVGKSFSVSDTACNTLRVTLHSISELTHNLNLYMRIKIAFCCCNC